MVTHYNRITLCLRCLESIENQTISPFEVIIVDDHSSEDVSRIKNKALANGWQFIEKEQNRFVADSRKTGVKKATGTHVIFIDDDDYFHPNALAHFHELIERDDTMPWSCRLNIIREDGKSEDQPEFGVQSKSDFSAFINPLFSIHATMVPRELILQHQFDTALRYYEDIDLWLTIFTTTNKWNFSEAIVGVYDRSNEIGITRVSEKTYLKQVHTFQTFLSKHFNPAIQQWSRLRLLGAYYCLGRAARFNGLNAIQLLRLVADIYKDGNLSWRMGVESFYLLLKIL